MCYECDFEAFIRAEKDKYKTEDKKTFNDTFLAKVREKISEEPILIELVERTQYEDVRKTLLEITKDKDFFIEISDDKTILRFLELCARYHTFEQIYIDRIRVSVAVLDTKKTNYTNQLVLDNKRGNENVVYAIRMGEPIFKQPPTW